MNALFFFFFFIFEFEKKSSDECLKMKNRCCQNLPIILQKHSKISYSYGSMTVVWCMGCSKLNSFYIFIEIIFKLVFSFTTVQNSMFACVWSSKVLRRYFHHLYIFNTFLDPMLLIFCGCCCCYFICFFLYGLILSYSLKLKIP